MRRLVYLADALSNMADIFRYLVQESGRSDLAHDFVEKLISCCERLANLPGQLGTDRPELRPGIRSTPCQGHVIFFRYRASIVEIVNILSGHRDIDAHFRT